MKRSNNEERNFLDTYGRYLLNLRNEDFKACPQAELLNRYYKKELLGKQIRAIEDHIDVCSVCLTALERLQKAEESRVEEEGLPKNWAEIEKGLDKDFYNYLKSAPRPLKSTTEVHERKKYLELIKKKWQYFSRVVLRPQRLIYAGALAVLVIASLYSYAYLSRGKYFHLAQIEPERAGVLRAETSAPTALTEGLRLFGEGKYRRAIAELRAYLRENPYHYTANYYLGLSYLFNAEVNLLGLSYKFNESQVEEGIKYLENALLLSGENQFYQEDCHWYLGKAYLMKGDLDSAREQFRNILNLSQPNLMRKDEAREMVLELE